jgi:LmbE family N-acetylglucosaminyl deacetylase
MKSQIYKGRSDIKLSRTVIVFAPHPDDETLGCGGTIARKISEGYEVIIAIMTDGRYALLRVGGSCSPTPDELVQIRRKEAEKATKILGVPSEKLLFFDFEDRKLREHERGRSKNGKYIRGKSSN